jgi:competence protein ComEC
MGRPLIKVACVLVAGLILGQALTYFPLSVLTLIGLAILFEPILLVHLRRRGLALPNTHLLFAILLAAIVYHSFIATFHPPHEVSSFIGKNKITLTGYIDEPLIHYLDRSVVILEAQQATVGGSHMAVTGRVRLRGPGPFLGQYQYGDILQIQAALRAPRGFLNPGLFSFGEHLRRQGIVAEATVSHPLDVTKIGEQPSILLRDVYTWREKIRQAAHHSLKDEPLAIFLAMIIGETGHLTNTIRDRFMASGTTHILSISGSHLGLVAIVVFPLARWAILSLPQGWLLRLGLYLTASQCAALVTILPVLFYAMLAGGQVATIRSLMMILVYLLAVLVHREDNLLQALALATLLVLLWDPRALGDISFQLSYGSVLMIALAMEWFGSAGQARGPLIPQDFKQKLLEKGKLYLMITLAATLGTAPIVAYYFNQVSWVGILSNLLVVPIAGLVIVPLGLFCAVVSLFFDQPMLPLANLLQGLYSLFYGAVNLFSRFPWAELRVASPSLAWMLTFYLSLILLTSLWIGRPFNFSQLSPRLGRFRWIVPGLLLALPVVGMACPPIPGSSKPLRISFLDVGQGDSTVIQFPDGQVMVVDGGRAFGDFDLGRLVVAPYLWDQGIQHIHYLVATHPQLDHIGGLVFLMERFAVGEVWTNGIERDKEFYRQFRATLKQEGLVERSVSREETPRPIGPCWVHFLNPAGFPPVDSLAKPEGWAGAHSGRGSLENNRSIVLKLSCASYSFVLAGDIEEEAERELADLGELLRATVIKVPHHGSRGAMEPAFLEAVLPKVAVVSAGAHNPYGHPAPEVLSAYEELGSQIFRTDQQGAIVIEVTQDILRVRQFSDLVLRPVRWDSKMLFVEWGNIKRLFWPSFSLQLDKV